MEAGFLSAAAQVRAAGQPHERTEGTHPATLERYAQCKYLQTEGKIKTFAHLRKQKDSITSRLRLRGPLMRSPQAEATPGGKMDPREE